MSAENDEFPWTPYHTDYRFFKNAMRNHDKVADVSPTESDGLYDLTLVSGQNIRVFVCDCYIYGLADYHKTLEELGEVNAVVIYSIWCGYMDDVKAFCKDCEVGLFNIKEFMGALNQEKFWLYVPPED